MSDTTVRKWVYRFGEGSSEGDPARKDILGGKGAGLAAMSRAGLPVPPGFTISAECCTWIQKAAGAWPPGLEDDVRDSMAWLQQATGRTFGRAPKPLLVAVRSGAAVSMPGMMDTILNCGLTPALARSPGAVPNFWQEYADHIKMFAASVAGVSLTVPARCTEQSVSEMLRAYADKSGRAFPIEPEDVLRQSIDAVFESWNSERAVTYRRHNDIRGLVGTAVNVQAMFPSERSGILFTRNPNNIRAAEMILEASFGLGEVVVSGAVTPDIYVIDAETLAIKEDVPGERPAGIEGPPLTPEQVREIAEIGRGVEKFFGIPSDIEWGLADGRVALLQSRPIRGLDVLEDVEEGRVEEIERLRQQVDGHRVVWVAHNLGETLRAPTPLTWDIIKQFMGGSGGFGLMYRDFGYHPSGAVCEQGFLELICGRIYVDPRRAAGLFWSDMPFEYDMDEAVRDPASLERAPTKLNLEQADPAFFTRLPRLVWAMLRCSRKMRKARRRAFRQFEDAALPAFRRFLDETRTQDLAALATPELIDELDRRRRIVLDEFGKESLKPGFFGGMAQQDLTGTLTQLMGEDLGSDLARVLTTGVENDTTVEQNIDLYRVAHGEISLEQFLVHFGHRAANEMELAHPRWREDPSYLERMLDSMSKPGVTPPRQRHEEQVAARKRAEADLPDTLARWGGACLLEDIQTDLRDAQQLLPYRETGKHYLMMGYEKIRDVLAELSRRWDLGRDLFYLSLDELPRFEAERAEMVKVIAARKVRWRSAQKLTVPDVIDSEHLERLGRPEVRDAAKGLSARAIASGVADGPARIVFDPEQAGDLGIGYILVCPSTDPGWTPLFVNARGLVVERGGVLSHGAIVARDFGIPAVVCENATKLIREGERIEINGNHGSIARLDS